MNTDQPPLTREQIQQAITLLPDEEYNQLTNWLTDHDFQRWDKQIENDLESGRLDKLSDELHQEYRDENTQPLSMYPKAPPCVPATYIEPQSRLNWG